MSPSPLRFLVADENPDSRHILVQTLLVQFPEAVIEECRSGRSAIAVAESDKLDAIIAHDTNDYDGEPLVALLRNANRSVPIVMVWGYEMPASAWSAGADAFLLCDQCHRVGEVVAETLAGQRAGKRRTAKLAPAAA